jgi:DNA-binding SARP family transcriptional activator
MAARSSLQEGPFRQALKGFTDTLTLDEADDFRLSSLDDLRTAILEIQAKQASEKRMRDLTRLQSFLEAMEQYGNIIDIFLNTTEFVAFVWVRA